MTEADILRQVRGGWPSPRAVKVAMNNFDCDEATAIDRLIELRFVISEVRRAFGWTLEEAAVHVARLEPITPALMSRHGFTLAKAIIELLRAGG
jgi:hypothetical protein